MRAPLSWLREHTDLPAGTTPQQVLDVLWRVGLEEEAVHGGDLTGPVVVGRVLSVEPEPQKNGKTIHWCQVQVGPGPDDVRGIVCGASNFGAGDPVVVALPGAVLPGGFEISARKTYGHVSDGMICSERELGLGDDHAGIIVLERPGPGDAEPGTDAIALLGLDDVAIEVNVNPDRGYCFSLRGIAREYALATGGRFTDPADVEVPLADGQGFPVRLADDSPVRGRPGCDRYVARVVRGFDPGAATPDWMRTVLTLCGMRPISLAVDVTNYVMLATGQPLHAFDLDRLGERIVVRRARAGERLTTLDDIERTLDPQDLLITDEAADGTSRVLALAGVMGGASSEVAPDTTNLLVESAHFDPVTVARTARRHKLGTEAARRYERGVDTDLADRAAELAVRLLVEHGGGRAEAVTDVDQRAPREPITLQRDLPRRLAGRDYTDAEVREALEAVGCTVSDDPQRADRLVVMAPSWRPDLLEGADLVEEVARVHGYDTIPVVLPAAPAGRGLTREQRLRRSAARALAEQGLVEVLTYPFMPAERLDQLALPDDDPRRTALRLANPLSEQAPLLRTSVLATLPDAVHRNLSRGTRDVAVFEIGRVFRPHGAPVAAPRPAGGRRPDDAVLHQLETGVPAQPLRAGVLLAGHRELPGWWGPGRAADWTDAVAAVQGLAASLGLPALVVTADQHAPWHPGRCARLALADGTLVAHAGELAPAVVAALDLPERTCAAEVDLDVLLAAVPEIVPAVPVPTHPVALRDVALVVDADVAAADVERALRDGGGALLEQVRLFDEYRGEQVGEGKRSLAYRLVLRAPDRTLTGDEASAARDAAVTAAFERTGATLRD
ncbi:phenylalanine--tRNA ligase subunit beta [Angustibacter sp. Root456]|uniref:phenylalanine--tRNA ligase subunit beta n=1 Tax=Angustibacter sp. Root456 TaxID=1736539 RepID=UPI0006FCE7E0|nr:phenylalanine--tRNA ligase subunit beta [Angustibacter sp. Root456]KQX63574.1 phenylalanine--tRNA ligase subunit beta [Angustibacter sp. Root456]